ncbi:MAG: LysM peptidoglycan-binding domain-containing protein, partial [Eubacteriales bacterium]|nr:LysM peptidoglycan-binding domain-containing protein [Eubacteriales bacterium]
TVSSGDTLWSIAEENMTEEYAEVDDYINEVVQINHLTSEYLRPGQNLTVPYYSTEYKD